MNLDENQVSLSNRENLAILNRVRLVAIFGQTSLILLADYYFKIHLPTAYLAGLIAGEMVFQWLASRRIKRQTSVSAMELLGHFIFDSVLLAVLVYFSGGANNPFIYLLLLPLALGTLMLPPRHLLLIAGLQLLLYSILNIYQRPLHLGGSSPLMSFHLHLAGMWVNFGLTVVLIAVFGLITRLSMLAQEKQISRLREKQLKDEQLLSLGIISASAAHELGTPLSTMAIIIDDLKHQTLPQDLADDLTLIEKQIASCRGIIQTLGEKSRQIKAQLNPEQGESVTATVNFKLRLQQVFEHWLVYRPQVQLHQSWSPQAEIIDRELSVALEQAITNLLNNAADASLENGSDQLKVTCEQVGGNLVLEIEDWGKGLSAQQRKSLGAEIQETEKTYGLGWGLFLSNASIEREGGKVELLHSSDHRGTLTRIKLPLTRLPAPIADSQSH